MKRYTCVLPLLAIVLTSLALPSTARAAESYRFWGKAAYGNFFSTDPTGCIFTTAVFFANENRIQDSPGAPTEGAFAAFSFTQWNDCTVQMVDCFYGAGPLPDDAFSMAGSLTSATLNTTIAGNHCITGAPRSISIAIDWTGIGEVFHQNNHTSHHLPGSQVSYHTVGRSRNAILRGSVSSDGTTLSFENGDIYGTLDLVSSGELFRSP